MSEIECNWKDWHLKVQQYRRFGQEPQGFEGFWPLNVIVGRNNVGKSSLIAILQSVTRRNWLFSSEDERPPQTVVFSKTLKAEEVRAKYPRGKTGEPLRRDWWGYGKRFVGERVAFSVTKSAQRLKADMRFKSVSLAPEEDELADAKRHYLQTSAKTDGREDFVDHVENPFDQLSFVHLGSDRVFTPETSSGDLTIEPDGTGATRVIQSFLHDDHFEHGLVENEVLSGLNRIFRGDFEFTRIKAQRVDRDTDLWEVFLEDSGGQLVALSESGSGLKTALLVLANLYLVPKLAGVSESRILFAFEELENNLHPAAQRRLFAFLREFAVEKKTHIFLTTHSPVVIDQFADDEQAQLIHVRDTGEEAVAETVDAYRKSTAVLDDLAVRASDLLQANGIIWVEGPSDRIYVNRWIELWSEGQLHEGEHYQCAFYGGALLAHYTGAEPGVPEEDVAEFVELLRMNRNVILLADSDRTKEGQELKPRVASIQQELKDQESLFWVTAGKEVENYVALDAMKSWLDEDSIRGPAKGKWADVPKYLTKKLGRNFDKVRDARSLIEHIERDQLERTLDLARTIYSASLARQFSAG